MINITEKYHSEKLKKLPNMRDYGVNPLNTNDPVLLR